MSERTRVRRRAERGRYDREFVHAILDEASAKVRSGPPLDTEEDVAAAACWAGVIPLRLTAAPPRAVAGYRRGTTS